MSAYLKDSELKSYLENLYGKPLSSSELLEYKNSLIKFFNLLIEIDQTKGVKNEQRKSVSGSP